MHQQTESLSQTLVKQFYHLLKDPSSEAEEDHLGKAVGVFHEQPAKLPEILHQYSHCKAIRSILACYFPIRHLMEPSQQEALWVLSQLRVAWGAIEYSDSNGGQERTISPGRK